MKSNKKAAKIVGVLFITCSRYGDNRCLFYTILSNGPDYLTKGAEHANQVILGALMELITCRISDWYCNYNVSIFKKV